MEEEYRKILRSEMDIIHLNTLTIRNPETLKERYHELKKRKERLFDQFQINMLEITLTQRALKEMHINWNNKKYWGEE